MKGDRDNDHDLIETLLASNQTLNQTNMILYEKIKRLTNDKVNDRSNSDRSNNERDRDYDNYEYSRGKKRVIFYSYKGFKTWKLICAPKHKVLPGAGEIDGVAGLTIFKFKKSK